MNGVGESTIRKRITEKDHPHEDRVFMTMRSEIRILARMEEGPSPFLSLYLNTQWDDEQQRERIRLFTKHQLKKGCDQ